MLKLMVLFSPSKRDKTRLLLKNMDVMPGLGEEWEESLRVEETPSVTFVPSKKADSEELCFLAATF